MKKAVKGKRARNITRGSKVKVVVLIVAVTLGISGLAFASDNNVENITEVDTEMYSKFVEDDSEYVNANSLVDNIYEVVDREYNGVNLRNNGKAFRDTEISEKDYRKNVVGNTKILQYSGVFNEYGDGTKAINRLQLSAMMFKIMSTVGKAPELRGYQIGYKDNEQIPNEYITAVATTTYLRLHEYGENFEPDRNITKEELKEILGRFDQYMANTERNNKDENGTDMKNFGKRVRRNIDEQTKNKIEERLSSRVEFRDRIKGRSVALHKSPRNLTEIQDNLDRIKSFDPYNIESVKPDYINADEYLIDTSMIEENGIKINGITVSKRLQGVIVEQCPNPDNIKLLHPCFANYVDLGYSIYYSGYLVANGEIIGKGFVNMVTEEIIFNREQYEQAEFVGLLIMYDLENNYDLVLIEK